MVIIRVGSRSVGEALVYSVWRPVTESKHVNLTLLSASRQAFARLLKFVAALWGQFNRDKVVIRASGLAYSALLATVPLVAVLFALFSAFSAFDELKQRVLDLLFSQLIPASQDEIVGYIDQFILNTRSLGLVGFVGLMVTAILLLDNIESNFNDIWHVRQRRRFISKVTAYTSVLVFGTILIGVSLTVSARIKAMLFSATGLDLPVVKALGTWLFPLAASFLTFLLMFLIIPSTRVRFRSAVVGAVFTSVAWEVGKYVFALSVGQSVRYSTIYGSLATFPIFLVWLYLSWIIVLIGLEVVYTHQNFAALTRTGASLRPHGRQRLSLTVKMFSVIAQRFDEGGSPPTRNELADRLVVPLNAADELVALLTDSGLVREVADDSEIAGFVPATSLDRILVSDVVRTVFGDEAGPLPADSPVDQAVDRAISDFEAGGHAAIEGLSFRDFLKRG
jgi:membrane protein